MDKNKYTFAQELLRSYKLTPEQKERVLALVARERNEDIVRLEEKVASLEKNYVLIEKEEPIEKGKVGEKSEKKPIYYTEISVLPEFLKSLNEGKFTNLLTHKIDNTEYSDLKNELGGEYTYTRHLEEIKKEFERLKVEKGYFGKNIYEKVNVFINGGVYEDGENKGKPKVWSKDRYQMNWSHPDLLAWSERNPHIPPSPDDDLKSKLQQEGFSFKFKENIIYFSDLVMRFKNDTRIRQGNSIRDIIENLNWDYDFNIEYKAKDDKDKTINIDTIDFFTDVEKLTQIFSLCLHRIKKYGNDINKDIEVRIVSNKNDICIDIVHLKNSFTIEKNSLKFGDTSKKLMRLANGVCDVSIIANFPNNECYLWPIWENYRMIDEKGTVRFNSKEKKEIIPSETLKIIEKDKQQAVIYRLKISRGL